MPIPDQELEDILDEFIVVLKDGLEIEWSQTNIVKK
jgi:hypothetical protein